MVASTHAATPASPAASRQMSSDAAGLEQPESAEVDLLVAARGRVEGVLAPREGRRVEHDEAEAIAGALEAAQSVEGVVQAALGTRGQAVERQCASRGVERLGRGV